MLKKSNQRIATFCVCCGNTELKRSPAILMPFVAHRVFGWEPVPIDESWGLNTIQSGNAYSICASLYCSDCNFLFLDIRFSNEELSRLYQGYRGVAYSSLREKYEPGYLARNADLEVGINYVAAIEEFIAPHLIFPVKVLDWGGDTGTNTPFRDRRCVHDIVEVSNKEPIEGARFVAREQAMHGGYDLVVCSNVLEHVPYPLEIIADLRAALGPNSLLYLELPFEDLVRCNLGELQTLKRHWHEHINFFSEKSIRRLLSAGGLRVIDFRVIQVSVAGRAAHVFQLLCKPSV